MYATGSEFTLDGLRKQTIVESECVEIHELWSDDGERRLLEVVLDYESGCDDTCQHYLAALDVLGPWAHEATPSSETVDPITGRISLLLRAPVAVGPVADSR